MRVFVTGGTGFIGSHVVKELKNKENALLLLSRQPKDAFASLELAGVDVVRGDLSDIDKWRDDVERFRPEVAIHLAWQSLPDYDAETSIRNLNYGLNLITMLAEIGCKSVICAGSCWEYGQQSGEVSEEAGLKPFNAFSAAKNSLHWLGRQIAEEHDMRFIWTRLFYVYGPGQRETSLIPHVINCVRQGMRPKIKNPLAKNDFIYVGDVAEAMATIAEKPDKDGVYNIGSGRSTSVHQIVKIVCDKLDFLYDAAEPDNPEGDLIASFWADISNIKRDIGWEPKTSIDEGIQEVIEHILG